MGTLFSLSNVAQRGHANMRNLRKNSLSACIASIKLSVMSWLGATFYYIIFLSKWKMRSNTFSALHMKLSSKVPATLLEHRKFCRPVVGPPMNVWTIIAFYPAGNLLFHFRNSWKLCTFPGKLCSWDDQLHSCWGGWTNIGRFHNCENILGNSSVISVFALLVLITGCLLVMLSAARWGMAAPGVLHDCCFEHACLSRSLLSY